MGSHQAEGEKLHIGCGDARLPGWINIDIAPYPAVDLVHDVTRPLPFSNCSFIFAEHFIEHLRLRDACTFLTHCRNALATDGVLRLTTPNLDWVWATQYHPTEPPDRRLALQDCLHLNRAFYGWGHRFLFNRSMLESLLQSAGFDAVTFQGRGVSSHPELSNLETHETCVDTPDLPHVLVAEGTGRRLPADIPPFPSFDEYIRDTEAPFHLLQYATLSAVRLLKRTFGRAFSDK